MFPLDEYPDLLVGLGAPDDAAVWRILDDLAVVVTIDFFTPVVDEPYDYGSIAAANAFSDLYAMGAKPLFALNVMAIPASLPVSIVAEILRGGAEKVREAGAVLAGGHSIQDDEPKYGLVAVGMVSSERMMTKAGAKPGDILLLSKPIGMGVTTTALKNQKAIEADVAAAVRWMRQLNDRAAELAASFNVRSATDVTGYSLLGHGLEMADASGVRLRFYAHAVPFLRGARRYAEGGHFPGGSADNRLFFGPRVDFDADVDEYDQMLLFDAQTSGGLLMAVRPESAAAMLAKGREEGVPLWPIGEVLSGGGAEVSVAPWETTLLPSIEADGLWFAGGAR